MHELTLSFTSARLIWLHKSSPLILNRVTEDNTMWYLMCMSSFLYQSFSMGMGFYRILKTIYTLSSVFTNNTSGCNPQASTFIFILRKFVIVLLPSIKQKNGFLFTFYSTGIKSGSSLPYHTWTYLHSRTCWVKLRKSLDMIIPWVASQFLEVKMFSNI